MRSSFSLLGVLFLAALLILPGCSGLKWWQKDDYFQMTLDEDFDPMSVNTVGVFVFSEGEQESAVRTSAWTKADAVDIVENLISLPLAIVTLGGLGARGLFDHLDMIDPDRYPPRVMNSATFRPDTVNSGPSLELANAIKEELEARGYNAKVVTELGHSGKITTEQCLAYAREHKQDAAFITCYRGINRWQKYEGSYSASADVIVRKFKLWEGFLYLPNSAFFLSDGDMLWSNSYYGVVQTAHIPNVSDERLIEVVPEAIIEEGGPTYFEAVEPAIGMIFEPKYWPGSHKPFPSRREKGSGTRF